MSTDRDRPVWVFPLLIAGVLSFAASSILIRYAAGAPSLAVAAIRTTFAVFVLAPAGVKVTRTEWKVLAGRDMGLVVVAGVLLGIHFVSWITSVYLTSVASAAVLVSTGPIFLAGLGYLALGEKLDRRVALAIGIAVIGSVLHGLGDWTSGADAATGRHPMLGNALALFAAFVWAVYLLIGRVVRQRLGWLAYVFPLYLVAGLTTLVAAFIAQVPLLGYSWEIYALCLVMALFPQILGHGSFNYAVKFFPAAFLGLLGLLEPVGATLLAWFLFNETHGPLAFVGMGLILVAVGSTVIGRPKTPPPVTD